MAATTIALDLRGFIQRAQVLALYRLFMRETRALPKGSSSRAELRDEVRKGFMSSTLAPSDAVAIKFAVSEGKLRLKQLKDMLGLMCR